MSEGRTPRYGDPAPPARLDGLQERITEMDDEIIQLIGERRTLAVEIGRLTQGMGLPVLDPAREARVVRRVASRTRDLGVDPELVRDVIRRIISAVREAQSAEPSRGESGDPDMKDSSDTTDLSATTDSSD